MPTSRDIPPESEGMDPALISEPNQIGEKAFQEPTAKTPNSGDNPAARTAAPGPQKRSQVSQQNSKPRKTKSSRAKTTNGANKSNKSSKRSTGTKTTRPSRDEKPRELWKKLSDGAYHGLTFGLGLVAVIVKTIGGPVVGRKS